MTLGPMGTVAQPDTASTERNTLNFAIFLNMVSSPGFGWEEPGQPSTSRLDTAGHRGSILQAFCSNTSMKVQPAVAAPVAHNSPRLAAALSPGAPRSHKDTGTNKAPPPKAPIGKDLSRAPLANVPLRNGRVAPPGIPCCREEQGNEK